VVTNWVCYTRLSFDLNHGMCHVGWYSDVFLNFDFQNDRFINFGAMVIKIPLPIEKAYRVYNSLLLSTSHETSKGPWPMSCDPKIIAYPP